MTVSTICSGLRARSRRSISQENRDIAEPRWVTISGACCSSGNRKLAAAGAMRTALKPFRFRLARCSVNDFLFRLACDQVAADGVSAAGLS